MFSSNQIKSSISCFTPTDCKNNKKIIQIALCGYKHSGKSTVASYLCDKYNMKELTFAGCLKNAVQAIFNVTHEQLHNPDLKEKIDTRWNITPRKMMQIVGSAIRHYVVEQTPELYLGPCISITSKNMFDQIAKHTQDNHSVIISDVRFDEEADMIKHMGIPLICIKRNVNQNTEENNRDRHESEQDPLRFNPNYIIENNNTIEELRTNIDKIVQLLYNK